MPKRDPRTGRFVKGGRRTTRKRATTRKRPARRRTATRRNPPAPDVLLMLKAGGMAAAEVLVGKAATRSVPQLLKLPQEGNTGLAVQIGTALLVGYAAGMFLSPSAAAAILAGGLTAPLETALVAYDVPWIGKALSPTSTTAAVQGYAMGRYPRPVGGVGRYPMMRSGAQLKLAGYPGADGMDELELHHSTY